MGRKKDKRKTGSSPHASSRGTGRTGPRLTSMVPVRFEPTTLDEIKRRASEDDRTVSAWIRRAVERELKRDVNA